MRGLFRLWIRLSLASLILVSYMVFSYYYFPGWWYSSIGTFLMLGFSYLLWGDEFLQILGLRLSLRSALKTFVLAVIITAGSVLLISYIGSFNGVAVRFTGVRNYYHDVFYILNEEIILGGIPIYYMVARYKINSVKVSVGLAFIFTLMHLVFYRWIFLEKGLIEPVTLISLFMVGIVRNNLIIVSRHIGYSWALHFGWMVVLFGSSPYWIESGNRLTEPERFNMFLGSNEMLATSIVLAGISMIHLLWLRHRNK